LRLLRFLLLRRGRRHLNLNSKRPGHKPLAHKGCRFCLRKASTGTNTHRNSLYQRTNLMAYPSLTAVSAPVSTGLATTISIIAQENQTFSLTATTLYEGDADGLFTTVPLGQSGAFVLLVDSEQILCSSFSEGVCE